MNLRTVAASIILTLLGTAVASASPLITASAPFPLENFGTASSAGFQSTPVLPLVVSGETITFATLGSPTTGIYAGNVAGAAVTPYGSGLANYLAVEPNGLITITFPNLQTGFIFLAGSVDPYNSLTFLGTNPAQTVTGTSIISALGDFHSNTYVSISNLNPFTSIQFSTTDIAFEFAPGTPVSPVPEPLTLSLFGAGLLGAGALRRRRNKNKVAAA